MSALVITSLENNHDASTCTLQIDRAPTGAIGFRLSPIPEEEGELLPEGRIFVQSPTQYRLTVPPLDTQGGPIPPRLYWVRADDDGGLSAAKPVWIALLDQDDIDEVMEALENRLFLNKEAIELRMRKYAPEIEIAQIIWGMHTEIEDTPTIEVNQENLDEPYYATEYYAMYEIVASISGFISHNDVKTEERLNAAFGRAVQRILNQRAYEEMTLTSGIVLTGCRAQRLMFDRTWTKGRTLASWQLTWRGEYGGATP